MLYKINRSSYLKQKIYKFKEIITDAVTNCNDVYLVGHTCLDFDAIASLGAMALICDKLNKAPRIVICKEELDKMETDEEDCNEKEMIRKLQEKYDVISLEEYEKSKQKNSLLIVLDTNNSMRTPFVNHYDDFKEVLIIDHHKEAENTIKRSKKLILDNYASSCSEIMYWLIKQYKILPLDSDYYTFLLTGIYLDTNKLYKGNTMESTRECVQELLDEGMADKEKAETFLILNCDGATNANNLFGKVEEKNANIKNIKRIDNSNIKYIIGRKNVRYAIAVDNELEYTKKEVSIAADLMASFSEYEFSILCGKNKDGKYEVSARSNRGNVDISKIMNMLNRGGGSMYNAACSPIFIDAEGEKENEILMTKIVDIINLVEKPKRYYIKYSSLGKLGKGYTAKE